MCQVTTGRSQLADKANRPNNIKHKGHAHCVQLHQLHVFQLL